MKIKASAFIAALCACAAMTAMSVYAGAQDVIDGAGDIVEGVGNGAADIVEGVGDGAANAIEGIGEGIENMTDGDRRDETTGSGNDYGKDENDVQAEDDYDYDVTAAEDRNPATGGIPFMPAGLIAVSAAGIAYLTKKRNAENGL